MSLSSFSPQLSDFKYFYQKPIILFTTNHLFVHSWMVPTIAMYLTIQQNIKHFFYTNDQTVLFLTIYFSINYLFEYRLNNKLFNMTDR